MLQVIQRFMYLVNIGKQLAGPYMMLASVSVGSLGRRGRERWKKSVWTCTWQSGVIASAVGHLGQQQEVMEGHLWKLHKSGGERNAATLSANVLNLISVAGN